MLFWLPRKVLFQSKGEIYGLLGPNGAGKTSVMKMIINYWKPTGGEIEIFGEKLTPKSYKYLSRIGSIIEFPVFYEHLSGESNLQLHCKYMGYKSQSNIEKVLDLLEMSKDAKRPVRHYSLGMKQRLAIARTIVTEPEILVLDESTNGLTPTSYRVIMFRQYTAERADRYSKNDREWSDFSIYLALTLEHCLSTKGASLREAAKISVC